MSMQIYSLTAKGIEEIANKVEKLHKEVALLSNEIDNILISNDYDDQMFLSTLEEKQVKESQLAELNNVLHHSQMTNDTSKAKHTIVELGDTVYLQNHVIAHTVTIVDHYEADPASGKVSSLSPIGSAALGKKLGEFINVPTPNGIIEFEIKSIL